MKRLLPIVLLSIILLSSCDDELGGPTFVDANPDDVEIRVSNDSPYNLDDFNINTGSGKYNYGSVFSNTESRYWVFPSSYPYFAVNFSINGKEFDYTPASYAGAKQVDNGKYSALIYEIDTTKLTFTFRLEPEN